MLSDDVERITDFYRREGFSDVEVNASLGYEKKGIALTFTIEEGERYYIGEIKIIGNQNITGEEIEQAQELREGAVYSEQSIYEESTRIREVYVNKGYIFSQVEPSSYFNVETEKVKFLFPISNKSLNKSDTDNRK